MSEKEKQSTISKQTPVTIGMVIVICGIVAVSVTGTVKASFAKEKVQTLEQSLKQIAEMQIKLTSSTTINQKKSDENGELLKKLSEVQIKQQLILNTQNVELRYIKDGIKTMLKRGG